MQGGLVEGRDCGGCTVCCTALTIDEPDLQKLPGVTCPNCRAQGCGIYQVRPEICRVWFCGWRQLTWVGEGLRPDRSGVLVRLAKDGLPQGYAGDTGVEFALLTRGALHAAGLAEAIGAAITARIATFLTLPGPAGFSATRLLLNEHLAAPVAARDKPAMVARLRRLATHARRAAHRPIALTNS